MSALLTGGFNFYEVSFDLGSEIIRGFLIGNFGSWNLYLVKHDSLRGPLLLPLISRGIPESRFFQCCWSIDILLEISFGLLVLGLIRFGDLLVLSADVSGTGVFIILKCFVLHRIGRARLITFSDLRSLLLAREKLFFFYTIPIIFRFSSHQGDKSSSKNSI